MNKKTKGRLAFHKLPPADPGSFEGLCSIVHSLRGPGGCPWDREQNLKSLAKYAIEEACEYAEAVDSGDAEQMLDELGDVLLQVVLNSEVARQEGSFTLRDVTDNLSKKMVSRHPHVFAHLMAKDSKAVLTQWDQIKAKEKKSRSTLPFDDIPKSLPSLQRSAKIGARTEKQKFDWSNPNEVFVQLVAEVEELREELEKKSAKRPKKGTNIGKGISRDALEHEIGDVLFTVAQLARHLQLDPEQCLRQANLRFEKRYQKMIELFQALGKSQADFAKTPQAVKERLWQKAKAILKKQAQT